MPRGKNSQFNCPVPFQLYFSRTSGEHFTSLILSVSQPSFWALYVAVISVLLTLRLFTPTKLVVGIIPQTSSIVDSDFTIPEGCIFLTFFTSGTTPL